MIKCYKLVIVLVLSTGAWAQNGEVSNGGFENWSDIDLYDFTTEWITSNEDEYQGVATVLQSTDAQEGTYAVDLLSLSVGSGQNVDTLFGYVFHGQIGPSGPDGGIAYGDTFDEVRVQYKSSMVTGDTAMMIMMRFSGGTMVEMNTIPFATSSQTNWTDASISVSNTGQDSLFIGFIMGNPFTENFATPGSWVRVDNVRLLNGGTEVSDLPDPSFELWDSESVQEPNDWFTMNQFLVGLGAENATQTTDAFAGNYALELLTQEDPYGGDTLQGFISAGPINFFGMNPFSPIPYEATPTTFSGAYKYNQVNGDVARIQVTFFESGNIIGGHVENIAATYTVWQTFSAPLSLSATPDSMVLVAFSGDNPGSVLTIDELSLSGGDVGIEDWKFQQSVVYPNPANDFVRIQTEGTFDVNLYDLSGSLVLNVSGITDAVDLDLNAFDAGSYVVQIIKANRVETHALMID